MSINSITLKWWFFALTLLAGTLLGGLALLIALALGAANPSPAGPLQTRYANPDDWPLTPLDTDLNRYHSPDPLTTPQFTVQASAINTGTPDSGWGLWLELAEDELFMLINNEGYFSVARQAEPIWAGFMHIQPDDSNQIKLDIAADGMAALRINHELAWEDRLSLSSDARWGVIRYRQPIIAWDEVLIFAP